MPSPRNGIQEIPMDTPRRTVLAADLKEVPVSDEDPIMPTDTQLAKNLEEPFSTPPRAPRFWNQSPGDLGSPAGDVKPLKSVPPFPFPHPSSGLDSTSGPMDSTTPKHSSKDLPTSLDQVPAHLLNSPKPIFLKRTADKIPP